MISSNTGALSESGINSATNGFIESLTTKGQATYNGVTYKVGRNPATGEFVIVETP